MVVEVLRERDPLSVGGPARLAVLDGLFEQHMRLARDDVDDAEIVPPIAVGDERDLAAIGGPDGRRVERIERVGREQTRLAAACRHHVDIAIALIVVLQLSVRGEDHHLSVRRHGAAPRTDALDLTGRHVHHRQGTIPEHLGREIERAVR